MEILFVSHKYPPAIGGMEKQSYELIEGMRKHAVVHKIVYRGEESYFRFFWKLNGRILSMIRQFPKITTIHFNDGLVASLSLWHVGYRHLRCIVTLHGLDVVFPLKVYQRFIIPRFNKYDHIVAVSHATASAAVKRGIAKNKISVIANGIDHRMAPCLDADAWDRFRQRYRLPDGHKILVTLGRPVKRKGFSWFIREVLPLLPENYHLAMAGPFNAEPPKAERWILWLPKRWASLYMLFMGYPSDQTELSKLLNDPTYTKKVTHLGTLPSAELNILMSHATAFLMPNIPVEGDMEGFGLVALEASACGTLVLTSALEGITDAIQHRKNGIQVEPKDAEAWRDAVEKGASDIGEEQLKSFRAHTLRHFSWNKMVVDYAALFRSLQL